MNNNYEQEANLLMMRFENLSEEGQKKFLKKIILERYFNNYVNSKVEILTKPTGRNEYAPKESEIQEYKESTIKKVDTIVDSFLDSLSSDDETFKSRLFDKFIKNYCNLAKDIKEGICGYTHDFSEWNEEQGTIHVYDEYGEIVGFRQGTFYTRQCNYCGKIEKVYSLEAAKQVEGRYEYWENMRNNNKKNGQ